MLFSLLNPPSIIIINLYFYSIDFNQVIILKKRYTIIGVTHTFIINNPRNKWAYFTNVYVLYFNGVLCELDVGIIIINCMDVLGKIKSLQEEKGWSTYKLAYEAGLTQSTLSNMFSRKTYPTIETLSKICDAFGITLSEFFEEGEEKRMYVSKEGREYVKKYRALDEKEKDVVKALIVSLYEKNK